MGEKVWGNRAVKRLVPEKCLLLNQRCKFVPGDIQEAHSVVTITSPDPNSSITIRRMVADEVLSAAKEHSNRVLRYFFVAVVGAIAASVWNLNGEIYKAVGEAGVSTKAQELEVIRLRDEVGDLKKQLSIKDCLENKKVSDKAGCYK